jgi:predicted HAD superfamily Cof-like phosphohydrolase
MMRVQDMVLLFHTTFGVPIGQLPMAPNCNRILLRLRLIDEEFQELLEASIGTRWESSGLGDLRDIEKNFNFFEAVDALADLVYVIYGAALELGVDLDAVIAEVHAANMRKVGGPTRADGKILKPEGWQPPDVAGVLARQAPLR